MSRKSRVMKLASDKINKNDYLKVAGYVRLSVVKDDVFSNSIENQSNIIKEYISNHSYLKLHKIYVDKNVSGSTFDRKGFNEILDDINNGEINCVIVKDLSRLGRDSISVGYYIQQFFPINGVRFISIDDKFDTINGITNIDDSSKPVSKIPIITIIDEYYSRDISKKVQSTIDANIKAGRFVAPRAPFGYMKSENDCHKLIIDENAASVVREIFQLAYNKYGLNKIVKYLNQKEYLTPINYAISNGLKCDYERGNGLWNTRTVKNILTNKVYIGDLEQGKEKCLVKNTHKAIIDRNVFNNVQNIFENNKKSNIQSNQSLSVNFLKSKIICGDCGGKMQRRKRTNKKEEYYYFSCITNNRAGISKCNGMYVKEDDIYNAIKDVCKKFFEQNRYKELINIRKDLMLNLKCLEFQFENMSDIKLNYEAYVNGQISDMEYKLLNSKKDSIKTELSKIRDKLANINILIKMHEDFATLSYENILNEYVDKIVVYPNKNINVLFKENFH